MCFYTFIISLLSDKQPAVHGAVMRGGPLYEKDVDDIAQESARERKGTDASKRLDKDQLGRRQCKELYVSREIQPIAYIPVVSIQPCKL